MVATNTPINDLLVIHTKQAAYRSFVIAAAVPAGSVSKALFWDISDPYHYVRLQAGSGGSAEHEAGDLLIVGGEDHKTGQADDAELRYAHLEVWARARFSHDDGNQVPLVGTGYGIYRWPSLYRA